MLLVIGIFLIVVGISDFGIAKVLDRQHASATGGLGEDRSPAVGRMLRRTGVITLVSGAVFVVVGLLS